MNKTTNNQIILFLRAPEKGKVKTRLAQDLGEDRALGLYMQFAESVLEAARKSGAKIQINFCPADRQAMVEPWLGKDLSYFAQEGEDLGERMAHGLARAFDAGAQKTVLVGSDIPGIQSTHFIEAFELLDRQDMVIGPSLDGGYWLIGFTRQGFAPEVFRGIQWSTATVFSDTLELARKAGLSWDRLEALNDIDTAQDLEALSLKPVE